MNYLYYKDMHIIDKQIRLGQVPLFSGLNSAQLKNLEDSVREKSFTKGDILFLDGKPCDQVVIVRSGRVKVFRTAVSGREQILDILTPGDTCACNPGISSWCCSASSQAMTDCQVWILPREKYQLMIKTNAKMALSLNTLFAERLRRLNSLIEEVSLDEPKHRIIKFILDLSDLDGKTKTFELPFTHELIANRLGLVRETVTRHLQQLKREGFIDMKPHQIILLNRKALQDFLK